MKDYWNKLDFAGKFKLVTYVLLALVLIVFAFRNWQMVNFRIFLLEFKVPITLLILGSMIVGYSISAVIDNRKMRAKKKEIKLLQEEILSLKKSSESIES
jgi:uncharacterized integral membrane protein